VCALYDSADNPAHIQVAAFAKVEGFKPAMTYPVHCMATTEEQVSAATAEEEALQLCEGTAPDGGCWADVTVEDAAGAAILAFSHVWQLGVPDAGAQGAEVAIPYSDVSKTGRLRTTPGSALVFASGYKPEVRCLVCGEQSIRLERSNLEYHHSGGGCSSAGGWGESTRGGPMSALAMLLVRGLWFGSRASPRTRRSSRGHTQGRE
jgi:hypothetical protein